MRDQVPFKNSTFLRSNGIATFHEGAEHVSSAPQLPYDTFYAYTKPQIISDHGEVIECEHLYDTIRDAARSLPNKPPGDMLLCDSLSPFYSSEFESFKPQEAGISFVQSKDVRFVVEYPIKKTKPTLAIATVVCATDVEGRAAATTCVLWARSNERNKEMKDFFFAFPVGFYGQMADIRNESINMMQKKLKSATRSKLIVELTSKTTLLDLIEMSLTFDLMRDVSVNNLDLDIRYTKALVASRMADILSRPRTSSKPKLNLLWNLLCPPALEPPSLEPLSLEPPSLEQPAPEQPASEASASSPPLRKRRPELLRSQVLKKLRTTTTTDANQIHRLVSHDSVEIQNYGPLPHSDEVVVRKVYADLCTRSKEVQLSKGELSVMKDILNNTFDEVSNKKTLLLSKIRDATFKKIVADYTDFAHAAVMYRASMQSYQ